MKTVVSASMVTLILVATLIVAFDIQPAYAPEETDVVVLVTSMGNITIELFGDMPITAGNFKNLTQYGIYDGTIFHRVVLGFVIQGGDVTPKGITVPPIQDELPNKHSNVRGSIAMAKTSEPNSATSQFYLNLVNNTYLDTWYSVFGRVIAGMDTVDAISSVPVDVNDRPWEDVWLIEAVLGMHSWEGGTIYIRPDGAVDPPDAPLERDGDYYTVTNNIISGGDGIAIERDNMTLDGQSYTIQGAGSGSGRGIDLSDRNNVTIINLNIDGFEFDIWLSSASNNTILGNTITGSVYDGIYLRDSSHNAIRDNTMASNAREGISLCNSSENTIHGNNATGNSYSGVYLYSSSRDNTISANNLTNNDFGASLASSVNNTILGNTITASLYDGIHLWNSSYNEIRDNTIATNSRHGISLSGSAGNSIYHNNFVNNTNQVYIAALGYENVWDNGYPSSGNYWSGFTDIDSYKGPYQNETGSDGVWDHPYVIDADNLDSYPLTRLFGGLAGDVDGDRDVDIFDIVRMASIYGVAYPDPRYNRLCDMDLDGDIDIFDIVIAADNYGKSW